MANPAFGSIGTWVEQASGTTLTLGAPASISDGDILLAHIRYADPEGTPPSLTGWTAKDTFSNVNQANHNSAILWKRASSESGSYAFTVADGISSGIVMRVTGAIASGDPFTGTPNATGYANDGGAGGAASGSVTAAVDEALYVYYMSGVYDITSAYTGGSLTWTERFNQRDEVDTFLSLHIATAPQPTAGAVDANSTVAGGGFRNVHLYAIAPVASGGGGGGTPTPAPLAQRNRRHYGRRF